MKTNFFEQVAGLYKGSLLLNIQTDENGTLTVSAIARKGNETGNLPPMLLSGTAQELDEGFFEAIAAPVQKTQGLLTNLESYQKEVDKAGKAKDKSNSNKTAAPVADEDNGDEESPDLFKAQPDDKEAKAEKKRRFEEQMLQVKTLAQQMKYKEALAALPDAAEYPDKAEVIAAKRQEVEKGKAIYDQLQNQFND